MHHDSNKCDFLFFDSLCDKIILEKVCIIHIGTYIAYFLLLSPEPTLWLSCCCRQQMIWYLPCQKIFIAPKYWILIFDTPLRQYSLTFMLYLFGWSEKLRFTTVWIFRIGHNVGRCHLILLVRFLLAFVLLAASISWVSISLMVTHVSTNCWILISNSIISKLLLTELHWLNWLLLIDLNSKHCQTCANQNYLPFLIDNELNFVSE